MSGAPWRGFDDSKEEIQQETRRAGGFESRLRRGSSIDRSRVGVDAAAEERAKPESMQWREEKSWTRGGGIELGARIRGGRKERSWSRGSTEAALAR